MVSFYSALIYLGHLRRILFGPFPYLWVVVYHYLIRVNLVSFMTMQTFKIVVKTMFILDFDRMTMISEKNMLMGMGVCTTISNLIHVAGEALLRNHRKLEHYARWCFNVYLGKVCWNFYKKRHIIFLSGIYCQSDTK